MGLPILGIDIAKDKYVVTLLHNTKRQQREFINQPVEFKNLRAWLNKHTCPHPTGKNGGASAGAGAGRRLDGGQDYCSQS